MLSPVSGRSISNHLLLDIMHYETYHRQAAGVHLSSSACDWETLRSGADLRVTGLVFTVIRSLAPARRGICIGELSQAKQLKYILLPAAGLSAESR